MTDKLVICGCVDECDTVDCKHKFPHKHNNNSCKISHKVKRGCNPASGCYAYEEKLKEPELEWDSFIMYVCPNPECGYETSCPDPIIRRYSEKYKCEMEFAKCNVCGKESIYRM